MVSKACDYPVPSMVNDQKHLLVRKQKEIAPDNEQKFMLIEGNYQSNKWITVSFKFNHGGEKVRLQW